MGTAFDPTDWQPGQTPYSSSEMNKLGQGIAGAMPVGAIISSFVVHPGFVALDGSLLSRTTYDALWAWADSADLVGAGRPFGPGDGTTTFRAPDFTGRMLVGVDGSKPAGSTGGSESHGHSNPTSGSAGAHGHSQTSTGSAGGHTHSNPSTGSAGGHAHSFSSLTDERGGHAHSQGNTGSGGGHSHSTGTSSLNNTGTSGALSVASFNHTHSVSSAGGHAHSNPNTSSAGAHRHNVPNSDSVGSHSHSQGNTGSGGSHSHGNPDVATVSNHQHTVGTTDTAGHLPPWGAVVWQIRY